jgi:DNA-binding transcriptional regulator YiaG
VSGQIIPAARTKPLRFAVHPVTVAQISAWLMIATADNAPHVTSVRPSWVGWAVRHHEPGLWRNYSDGGVSYRNFSEIELLCDKNQGDCCKASIYTRWGDFDELSRTYYKARMSPEQCRAARAWLRWSQRELAAKAQVSGSTIRDFENGRRIPHANNLLAIRRAVETGGLRLYYAPDGTSLGIGPAKKRK